MAQIIQPIRNLVNGSRINGVEHIYQTSKPTTRVDGSALVIGDRWWKTDDGTEWYWNGTYWLTETYIQNAHGHQSTTCIYPNVAATLNNPYYLLIGAIDFPIFLQSVDYLIGLPAVSTSADLSFYINSITPYGTTQYNPSTNSTLTMTNTSGTQTPFVWNTIYNALIPLSPNNVLNTINIKPTAKTGAPSILWFACTINYKKVFL
jgi:hypothetical protein